jgi:glycerol transport system permease protein
MEAQIDNFIASNGSLDDLLFRGKNKGYGAYFLRKEYPKHLKKSLIYFLLGVCLLSLSYVLWDRLKDKIKFSEDKTIRKVTELAAPPPLEDKSTPPPPPPPPPPPVKSTIQFVPPKVVEVAPEEEMKTNEEIIGVMTMWPTHLTFNNYLTIFTDESWYSGYINSIIYVALNMVMSVTLALPAAYAFSRYSFLGDKHVFFWLLTNRMTPPAVFLLPFFQLYSTVGMMDTHLAVALAHLLFNVPLAVWILEGFMSGIPKEIDETAYIDGYSFPKFFVKIFLPLIKSGIGVTAFFCFMFSWVELLLARTLTSVNAKPIAATMTRTVSASGMDWGVLAAAGTLTIVPGALVIWFVRHYIAKGFAMGRV